MENQNQNTDQTQQTINIQIPSSENIAARRPLIPISFALVIIFFFFTFCDLKCGEQKIQSIKGIDFVTGKTISPQESMNERRIREKENKEIPSNIWAIIALGSAIVGLGVFLIKEKREALVGTFVGITGTGSLFILHYVVIEGIDEMGKGQIGVEFQFPYWGALISMSVAGFISYLRFKKTHKIIVNTTLHSPYNPIEDSNKAQSEPKAPLTNDFDIVKWYSNNKKIVLGTAVSLIVLYIVYFLYLQHDPERDAKKARSEYCECQTNFDSKMISWKENFLESFETYKFTKRLDVKNKIQEETNSINEERAKCYSDANNYYTELKNRYITNEQNMKKFDFAYNQLGDVCKTDNFKMNSFDEKLNNKIKSINEPIPDEQKIKNDILGQSIPGWNFQYLTDFKKIEILNKDETSDRLEFKLQLELVSSSTKKSSFSEIIVVYLMRDQGWTFSNLNFLSISFINTAPVNEWAVIRVLPNCSYNRFDNGHKYFIRNTCTGEIFEQGGGIANIGIHCNEIYIKSNESEPVDIVFKYKQAN